MAALAQIFQKVDTDRRGAIDAVKLQQALSNGVQGLSFNLNTIKLMISMFDTDRNGTINFDEFSRLFGYVQSWQQCYRQYDRDGSGRIDIREFENALRSFGYRLSSNFVQQLIFRFDRTGSGQIAFDDFIYACVCLQILTNGFKLHDHSRNGQITVSFEKFLELAISVVMI